MEINLTTPAPLFPAISLLMLAYTNRFLSLGRLIRDLHTSHTLSPHPKFVKQIALMRVRIRLIRNMQFCGVLSFLLCTICMFTIFRGWQGIGEVMFGTSLLLLMISLVLSLAEIQMSIKAIDLHISDIEDERK